MSNCANCETCSCEAPTHPHLHLFEDAIKKTLAAYRALIADPEGERPKWTTSSTSSTPCRFCRVTEETEVPPDHPQYDKECPVCPLSDGSRKVCMETTYRVFLNTRYSPEKGPEDVRLAARARLAWLVWRLRSAGVPTAWLRGAK